MSGESYHKQPTGTASYRLVRGASWRQPKASRGPDPNPAKTPAQTLGDGRCPRAPRGRARAPRDACMSTSPRPPVVGAYSPQCVDNRSFKKLQCNAPQATAGARIPRPGTSPPTRRQPALRRSAGEIRAACNQKIGSVEKWLSWSNREPP